MPSYFLLIFTVGVACSSGFRGLDSNSSTIMTANPSGSVLFQEYSLRDEGIYKTAMPVRAKVQDLGDGLSLASTTTSLAEDVLRTLKDLNIVIGTLSPNLMINSKGDPTPARHRCFYAALEHNTQKLLLDPAYQPFLRLATIYPNLTFSYTGLLCTDGDGMVDFVAANDLIISEEFAMLNIRNYLKENGFSIEDIMPGGEDSTSLKLVGWGCLTCGSVKDVPPARDTPAINTPAKTSREVSAERNTSTSASNQVATKEKVPEDILARLQEDEFSGLLQKIRSYLPASDGVELHKRLTLWAKENSEQPSDKKVELPISGVLPWNSTYSVHNLCASGDCEKLIIVKSDSDRESYFRMVKLPEYGVNPEKISELNGPTFEMNYGIISGKENDYLLTDDLGDSFEQNLKSLTKTTVSPDSRALDLIEAFRKFQNARAYSNRPLKANSFRWDRKQQSYVMRLPEDI
jgi:hypothetical protein